MALSQRDDGSLSGSTSIQHELEFNSSDESERLAEGEPSPLHCFVCVLVSMSVNIVMK